MYDLGHYSNPWQRVSRMLIQFKTMRKNQFLCLKTTQHDTFELVNETAVEGDYPWTTI